MKMCVSAQAHNDKKNRTANVSNACPADRKSDYSIGQLMLWRYTLYNGELNEQYKDK